MSAITINSINKSPSSAIIFIHGLGDSGNGWKFLADILQGEKSNNKFNHIKFIFPNAPTIPLTVQNANKIPSWFDIYEMGSINAKDDTKGYLNSISTINNHIDSLIKDDNVPSNRILLGGFSQGGSLTLSQVILSKHKLAGFISCSGFVKIIPELLKYKSTDNISKSIPNVDTEILQFHGINDRMISFKYAQQSYDFFKNEFALPNLKFIPIDGMGHQVVNEQLIEIVKFIEKTLPPLDSDPNYKSNL
ncbi:acyl-protein thioesterase 1 [Ascoidea rubescens DSM 1968]|uniref:Acyl-protein thioesterase 1 n=1 Tax=Ascoidea rubescens DSM 1968 TaxID=1344418 RepID=A0A1D2VRH4_9ASCO|nr:acyl-protein thioesterase 1 [Ascoidea rubescens DSM 1968]ODV64213.1 acyl-protein thioesterase 1 [Ascoidea rubescens DSM 1968]